MTHEKILRLNAIWERGLVSEYYAEVSNLFEGIISNRIQDDKGALASQLLNNTLSRKVPSGDNGDDDIIIMEKLALHLLSSDMPSESVQCNNVLISKFMGRIRQEIITDFKWLRVTANVSPPGAVPGFAGMSPEAIEDPAARAKYEQAIQENQRKNRINRRQRALADIDRQMSRRVVDYLIQSFREGKISRNHLIECMNEACFNNGEIADVLSKIGEVQKQ